VRIEVQTASEGMRHHHDEAANAVPGLQILLYDCASQGGQVMKEVAIISKMGHKTSGMVKLIPM